MPRRYKPTFEEYVEMGKQLKELHEMNGKVLRNISHKVGKSKVNKTCDPFREQMRIAKLRSELEEDMFNDYPEKATTKIFF